MREKQEEEQGEGWRLVVLMREKRGEVTVWELRAYPPGKGRLVSLFETPRGGKGRNQGFMKALLGKMERLLGLVAPGGLPVVVQEEEAKR